MGKSQFAVLGEEAFVFYLLSLDGPEVLITVSKDVRNTPSKHNRDIQRR